MTAKELFIEKSLEKLIEHLDSIQGLADSEKNALGFWPRQALRDAMDRCKLWVILESGIFKGFLIYSGVFPNAKIQAIATIKSSRKGGIAACLLRAFISTMEHQGYISIKAEIAKDLDKSLKFYTSQGFQPQFTKSGGKAKKRKIIVHVKELDNDTLFSNNETQDSLVSIGLAANNFRDKPFYVFDLNVYLDLVKNRDQSVNAHKLFSAALAHQIRLVVADELVVELQRNSSKAPKNDPILQLALRLPKLPKTDTPMLDTLADKIHALIFPQQTRSKQTESDAKHIAQAAMVNASAFVTRDGALLRAREVLIEKIGIDVIDLSELTELLPDPAEVNSKSGNANVGIGFKVENISSKGLTEYLISQGLEAKIIDEFSTDDLTNLEIIKLSVTVSEDVVAIGVLIIPLNMQPTARILIHVKPETPNCVLYSDHMLNELMGYSCNKLPTTISLANIPGQYIVRGQAKALGFSNSKRTQDLMKISLGRPITTNNWEDVSAVIRRRTGLSLPATPPKFMSSELIIKNHEGTEVKLRAAELEHVLSPSVLICKDRNAVVVPIRRLFADELLGTSNQEKFDFIEDKNAAFLRIRSYVNSPSSASKMKPNSPILFYESLPQNGRGAIVAIARIADVVVMQKNDIPDSRLKRLVVNDVKEFSKTKEILLTTFDNLIKFPSPVYLKKLREINAIDGANYVSPTAIDGNKVMQILDLGWEHG